MEKKQAWKGFAKDILIAVAIAFAITVFFKPVVVKGSSMNPTLTDSRDIGCVSVEAIEGKALIRLYPFNKIGGLRK